jgi:hypothetical protein
MDGVTIGRVSWITPLVTELQCFCQRHEEGDAGGAAAAMLAHLHHDWIDIPLLNLPPVVDEDRDPEELAMLIVSDVGEVAEILSATDDPRERLAFARANLIVDVERYRAAAAGSS